MVLRTCFPCWISSGKTRYRWEVTSFPLFLLCDVSLGFCLKSKLPISPPSTKPSRQAIEWPTRPTFNNRSRAQIPPITTTTYEVESATSDGIPIFLNRKERLKSKTTTNVTNKMNVPKRKFQNDSSHWWQSIARRITAKDGTQMTGWIQKRGLIVSTCCIFQFKIAARTTKITSSAKFSPHRKHGPTHSCPGFAAVAQETS